LPRVEATQVLRNESVFATEYLRPYFAGTAPGSVSLRLEVGAVEGQTSPEADSLVVDPQGVRIVGVSPAGVFYGLQSLRNLLPAPTPRAGLTLPAITVVDAPRFGYRGFMLDVARNFHPKAAVLRTIDLLARYKLNVLHLHLIDDHAWRFESKAFPRCNRPGEPFYTQAELKELVAFAQRYGVEIIPEFDFPGHAQHRAVGIGNKCGTARTSRAEYTRSRASRGLHLL